MKGKIKKELLTERFIFFEDDLTKEAIEAL